jgi:hypothetical protein
MRGKRKEKQGFIYPAGCARTIWSRLCYIQCYFALNGICDEKQTIRKQISHVNIFKHLHAKITTHLLKHASHSQ